ncbi:unnamed protein product [Amoebophrya sp. A120]|nr:unnamed protein product [Amoebophrya sp. A120]|eukprot:GSA120T00020232001.1
MLFREKRFLLSCYISSSAVDPKQADSRPHLPPLQERHFLPCNLRMRKRNYFNFDDFNPDASIAECAADGRRNVQTRAPNGARPHHFPAAGPVRVEPGNRGRRADHVSLLHREVLQRALEGGVVAGAAEGRVQVPGTQLGPGPPPGHGCRGPGQGGVDGEFPHPTAPPGLHAEESGRGRDDRAQLPRPLQRGGVADSQRQRQSGHTRHEPLVRGGQHWRKTGRGSRVEIIRSSHLI